MTVKGDTVLDPLPDCTVVGVLCGCGWQEKRKYDILYIVESEGRFYLPM